MRKLLRSIASVAVVAAVASGALVMGFPGSAFAAGNPPWEPGPEVGALLFYNAAGQQVTGGSLSAQPSAAYAQGTATLRAGDTKATLYGYLPVDGETPGQWSGEALSASTTFPNASAPSALASSPLPLVTGGSTDESISTLETDFPNTDSSPTDGYANMYVLRLKTSATGLSATTTYDSVDIEVDNTGGSGTSSSPYTGTWSVVYPAPTLTATTTTLVASPASPQVSGTTVTLTATVSPSAPGTVQFENGSADIGSPVTVSGGTASTSTASLPVGADTLNAVFTPAAFSAYSGSTGTTSFTVSPAPAAGTTTALSVNPSTAAADTAVALTADVTITSSSAPLASGAGSVSFYDNGTSTSDTITGSSQSLGTVSLGTGGIATLSYSLFAVGAHNIVSEFTPSSANTGVYNSSISLVVLFTATTPQYTPDLQTVVVGIPAGTLTITTPYGPSNPFNLGTAALNPGQTSFDASAPFGSSSSPTAGVTITDTRAGDLPWTASAEVSNFSDGATPTPDLINAQNLGFTGVTPEYITGNALQSPDVTVYQLPNTGAPYAPGATGTAGLGGQPQEFASATAGEGSVNVIGILTLTAPTSTPAGTYTATLTFTII